MPYDMLEPTMNLRYRSYKVWIRVSNIGTSQETGRYEWHQKLEQRFIDKVYGQEEWRPIPATMQN